MMEFNEEDYFHRCNEVNERGRKYMKNNPDCGYRFIEGGWNPMVTGVYNPPRIVKIGEKDIVEEMNEECMRADLVSKLIGFAFLMSILFFIIFIIKG